ncbi:MAG: hypothetical protein HXY24_14135 [Rubrivivax sp.]|nr:hypothetical protein [Rubrivivax sp.]
MIEGPWQVSFPPNWGAPEQVTFESLISWPQHPDPGIKYFSGTATYRRGIDVPAERLRAGGAVLLELGRVHELAEVRLNGQDLGILWRPPFRVEITNVARPGANELEVRVTNLWPNRLIGDAALPVEQRRTFTTWEHWKADAPLLDSGLLGPVRLIWAVDRELRPPAR